MIEEGSRVIMHDKRGYYEGFEGEVKRHLRDGIWSVRIFIPENQRSLFSDRRSEWTTAFHESEMTERIVDLICQMNVYVDQWIVTHPQEYAAEIEAMAQTVRRASRWVIFSDPGQGVCGYCGYDPETDKEHYCDGFGHFVESATGIVHGDDCMRCRQGGFCQKAEALKEGA